METFAKETKYAKFGNLFVVITYKWIRPAKIEFIACFCVVANTINSCSICNNRLMNMFRRHCLRILLSHSLTYRLF